MRKFFTTLFVVMFATIWVQAQATYSDFTLTACTGGVSTEQFHEGTQSYKTLGGGVSNPELKITINNITDWKTITKVSLWVYTTADWNNGQIAVNSSAPGWKSTTFTAATNSWVNLVWDFSATPFDAANSWGQFLVQYYNTSGDLYYDEITFYNAAGDVVYEIDASDVSLPPTSISLTPAVSAAIVGKTLPLSVSVVPSNAGVACSYTSSVPTVATVDNLGKVTAVSAGTSTITATSSLDALVTSTATVEVTEPDVANSMIYASFENGLGNYDGAWASWVNNLPGPVPTVEVVDNPSTTGNATAKVLKVSNFRQWGAIVFKAFDANKVNKIKFKVYSETAISDLKFEYELNGGTSTKFTSTAVALPVATWTECTYELPLIQSADHQVSIKLASAGSASTAYTIYFDDVELLAGTGFVPVASLTADGTGAVSTITVESGTLQMEAKDYLPVDASNQTVKWSIAGANVPVIATITPEGLITPVRNGVVTVRANADCDGAFAEKTITISGQNLEFSGMTAIAKKIVTTNISSADDFSASVQMTYDADSIYMIFDVKDDSIVNSGTDNYSIDNIEVYFDMANSKNPLWPRGAGWPASSLIKGNDYQLRLVPDSAWNVNNTLKGVNQVYTKVTGGYQFKVNIPIDSLSKTFVPAIGTKIGFDVLASDNDKTPYFRDQLSWNSPSDMIWNDPSYWGTVEFAAGGTFNVIEDTEVPTAPANVVATEANKKVTITWDASTDNVVVQSYIILKGTTPLDTILAKATANTFTVSNLTNGKYTFSIIAADVSGNKSSEGVSNEVSIINWTEFAIAKKLVSTHISSAADFSSKVKIRWDADSIYTIFSVTDDSIVNSGTDNYSIDNIEIYFDMANSKSPLWPRGAGWPNSSLIKGNDYQLRLVPDSAWDVNNSLKGVNQVYTKVTGGYQFTVNIPIDSLSKTFVPEIGTKLGFDVLSSDNDNDPYFRDQVSWNSNSDMIWNDPSYWGTIELAADGLFKNITDVEAPSAPANVVATANLKKVTLTWDAGTDNIVVQSYIILQGTTPLDTILAKASANTFAVNNLAAGNYTFSVITVDVNGLKSAGSASNEVAIWNTGIRELKASMTFGPNPVVDILNIQSSEIINNVAIYNISGKLERFVNVNSTSSALKFAEYGSGVYFVKVQTAKGVITQKIVKE